MTNDSFARELERENHALREAGGLMRAWIGNNEKAITERWDEAKNQTANRVPSCTLLGWIDCREHLPEMGEAVFLLEPTYGPMIGSRGWAEDGWLWGTSSGAVWHNGQRWDCDCHQDADYQPTYWHALPALPNVV